MRTLDRFTVGCHRGMTQACSLRFQLVVVPKSVVNLQDSPGSAMAIAGIVGGVFAATASHPFDTIKTRMQVMLTW